MPLIIEKILSFDLCEKIYKINHKIYTNELIKQFNILFELYWKEKFYNNERKYISLLHNNFNKRKHLKQSKNLKERLNNRLNKDIFNNNLIFNSNYIIYNDHYNSFKNKKIYVGYYFPSIFILKNNGKLQIISNI